MFLFLLSPSSRFSFEVFAPWCTLESFPVSKWQMNQKIKKKLLFKVCSFLPWLDLYSFCSFYSDEIWTFASVFIISTSYMHAVIIACLFLVWLNILKNSTIDVMEKNVTNKIRNWTPGGLNKMDMLNELSKFIGHYVSI